MGTSDPWVSVSQPEGLLLATHTGLSESPSGRRHPP